MKISIASYSFHGLLAEGKIDAFGYLESCRFRYGLDTADFWNGIIGTHESDYLTKVRQAAEERELEVVNYHVDGVHLWEDKTEDRERNYRLALEHLQAAATLGAKTVRFDTGGKGLEATEEQFDFLVKRYQEYCRFAINNGFKIGPENHWGFSLSAQLMRKLAETIDDPAYGILLHAGHWDDCDGLEGDKLLAEYAVHTHIDANVTRNSLVERISLLEAAGYSGCLGVEHHSTKNEYAEVAYQIAEVRRVLCRKNFDRHAAETTLRKELKTGNPLLTLEQERG